MGPRSLFLLCFLAVLPLYSEAESTPSLRIEDGLSLEWETGVDGPNVTEGCQRLPGGGECSTSGCPDGFTCSAAPGDTCACIKPCGKVSLDRCEGGVCAG